MTAQLPALKRLLENLAPFVDRNDLSNAERHRQDELRREAWPLLTIANEVAQRFFRPLLEEKRLAAREEVRELAGDDERRIAEMANHHFAVVRLVEFLSYVDCLGNNVEKRLALFIGFFGEALAETAPTIAPAK
jgi:hypothetical protein